MPEKLPLRKTIISLWMGAVTVWCAYGFSTGTGRSAQVVVIPGQVQSSVADSADGRPASPHPKAQRNSIVNVNTAMVGELVTLPGIGEVLAGRIVSYRDTAGRFESPDDLIAVKGIGPAKVKKIRPLICF